VDDTMLLETTFTTASGSVRLTDALAVGRNERGHELGAGAVSTVLRRVVGVAGSVDLELTYAPRPEYGLVSPVLQLVDGGVTARGGELLGNFPQAFSHIGLVNAAWAIAEAERRGIGSDA
jgi:hypothetical protein